METPPLAAPSGLELRPGCGSPSSSSSSAERLRRLSRVPSESSEYFFGRASLASSSYNVSEFAS